jgi:hypothetical protein
LLIAVSGWFSSCATLDAISPMVIRRLADCARSACAAACSSAWRRGVMSVAITICARRPSTQFR